ncbi:helix-turn-helix domain-containing protein [Actinomadura rudentiformis]|uniref:Helix-turn-helix domain-containing protein n=1 Tax=Actinomadura rudentiformis TaxID=359158 RepID=A0A6H9Z9T2_9ACTN|nr:helix-turn-helix domain-containing protein [Actinomadura rudentiformis]KAB2352193.1 helix-turn-helix domain-containing protein [Actinomadura rudentiformis]
MLINSDDFPSIERFERFQEAVRDLPVPVLLDCPRPDDFWAVWGCTELGDLSVASTSCRGLYRFRRTRELIRRSDPDAYRLVLNLRGRSGTAHHHRHAELAPGDLALFETSSPFDGWRGSRTTGSQWIMATFPRRLLPMSSRAAEPLLGHRLPGRHGVGALVGTMLHRLAEDVRHYRPADRLRLSCTLLDLLAVLLQHRLEPSGPESTEARHRTLMIQIRSFVRNRLGDPALSPEMIAAAHHISIRQLHRMFQAHGMTVAAWIRASRLERCRHDLADPAQRSRPVQVIASRWGFTDSAHFSRAFRATYGLSPQDYRRQRPPSPG